MKKQHIMKKISELEKKISTEWKAMPKGWNEGSRKKFWDTLVGDVEHKRTKCHKKVRKYFPSEDATWAFCQSLWDDFENK